MKTLNKSTHQKAQHTPGPWHHDETWGLIKAGKLDDCTDICALHSGIVANARLIAAAPELLEALQAMVRLHDSGDFGPVDPIDMAMAAIAKAKGEGK